MLRGLMTFNFQVLKCSDQFLAGKIKVLRAMCLAKFYFCLFADINHKKSVSGLYVHIWFYQVYHSPVRCTLVCYSLLLLQEISLSPILDVECSSAKDSKGAESYASLSRR